MSLESFVLDIIEKRTSRPGMEKLLFGLSFFYRAAIGMRNFLYDKSLLGIHSVPVPVVSIGNIVTGGTGKTPLIQYLCEELASCKKVAILTRGFRSSLEKAKGTKEISKGQGPLVPVEECGDEPYWLALHTAASIWVGRDKVASANKAFQSGAEVVLIDDGMQHRRLKRDIEIVVMDGKDLFGKGFYLPRGLLRDSPHRLKQADYVFVNHIEEKDLTEIQNKLKPYTNAPIVVTRPRYFFDESMVGKKVGVFCGIAKPHHFAEAVQKSGCSIVDQLFTLDHIVPSLNALTAFAGKCKEKGAAVLVCTEKDLVKLQNFTNPDLFIIPLKMKLEVVQGKENWKGLIEKLTGKKQ